MKPALTPFIPAPIKPTPIISTMPVAQRVPSLVTNPFPSMTPVAQQIPGLVSAPKVPQIISPIATFLPSIVKPPEPTRVTVTNTPTRVPVTTTSPRVPVVVAPPTRVTVTAAQVNAIVSSIAVPTTAAVKASGMMTPMEKPSQQVAQQIASNSLPVGVNPSLARPALTIQPDVMPITFNTTSDQLAPPPVVAPEKKPLPAVVKFGIPAAFLFWLVL